MKLFIRLFILCISVLCAQCTLAQPPKNSAVNLRVLPDHKDWIYAAGEPVKFAISAVDITGKPIENLIIAYKIGLEKMKPSKTGELHSGNDPIEIAVKGLDNPGFLRCEISATVNGKFYSNMATAAVSPLKLSPIVDMPADFKQFWDNAKAEAEKIPMDPKLRLLPEKCTEKVNVYEVSIQNFKLNSKIYGILCIPKAPGKYPAILDVPSAGIKPYAGIPYLAEAGAISFQIGIHGIPVTLDSVVYKDLRAGALDLYATFNLDDRDEFYFKRVFLGCVRAVDFIYSLPQFDGSNIAVKGGSQGGALAIVTAALDPRIKFLSSMHPAMCDHVAALNGRPTTWPNLFGQKFYKFNNKPEKIANSKYYDVVNFARLLTVPGYYTWGFNDTTCPPTTTYAAYNVITAPKQLSVYADTGHWGYPQQFKEINAWVLKKINATPLQ